MITLINILFLLLNGFFSLSEMAILSASKPILRDMVKRGNKGAANVLKLLEHEGKFLSTIQVGITAVGIFMAAYGGATIGLFLGNMLNKISFINNHGEAIAIAIVVTGLTYISVIIGELIPKRVALRNPEIIAIFVAKPMMSMSYLFSPIVRILDFSAEFIMKFFGVFHNITTNFNENELKAMISEGVETGALAKSEHEMMQRIFRLDDRDAKSIMTHVTDVTFIRIGDPINEIKQKLQNTGHSRYPVIENNSQKVIGVVQAKELLFDALGSGNVDIQNHLKEAPFISENTSCLKVLEMFKTSSIHLAVVLDEYGAVEGIVTASDIFEAVVGSISSNYDEKDFVMIKKRDDNSWLVDGMTPIDEINIMIGIEEINKEGKFDTIAGFVIDQLNKTPEEGDKIVKYGYSFEILDMDGFRLDKILIAISHEKI